MATLKDYEQLNFDIPEKYISNKPSKEFDSSKNTIEKNISPLSAIDDFVSKKLGNENTFRKNLLNIVPPNVRQFTYDVFGGNEEFNEKDLTRSYKKELKGIAENVLSQGKNTISYKDYDQGTASKSIFENIFSKNYNLKTLIGSGKISINENGEIIITDKFDYNDAKDINSLADVKEMISGIISAYKGGNKNRPDGIYGALREGIRYFGSEPGEGSDVKINLGKSDIAKIPTDSKNKLS